MRPLALRAQISSGSGMEIQARIPKKVNCAEFTLSDLKFQPIFQMSENSISDILQKKIGYDPWIQFAPKEWRDMLALTYVEMAAAWNSQYGANARGTYCYEENMHSTFKKAFPDWTFCPHCGKLLYEGK